MKKLDLSDCLPDWDALSDTQRQQLLDMANIREYKHGENIIFHASRKDGIIFVLKGRVRVYLASDSGREITLFNLTRGEAFSIMTVDMASGTDVIPCLQAGDNTTLAYLKKQDFAPLAYEEPRIASFVLDSAAKSAQKILNNISFYFFNSLRKCIAKTIVEKSELYTPVIDTIKITHEEIANNLGTTRVVISRELDSMRDQGLIATGRGKIHIINRAELEHIAGYH